MNTYERPVRKPMRLKGYDYSRAGCYFVTVCVKDRHKILGYIVGDAHPGGPSAQHNMQKTELTTTGLMVQKYVEGISSVYDSINIDNYVIMPNHIHLIVRISNNVQNPEEGPPGCAAPTKSTLAKAINAFKAMTSKQFGESMWQRSYHDHVIRNNAEYQRIWQYIDENPTRWTDDKYYPS